MPIEMPFFACGSMVLFFFCLSFSAPLPKKIDKELKSYSLRNASPCHLSPYHLVTLSPRALFQQHGEPAKHECDAGDPQPFFERQAGQPDIHDIVWVVVPSADPHDQRIPGPAAYQRAGQCPAECRTPRPQR